MEKNKKQNIKKFTGYSKIIDNIQKVRNKNTLLIIKLVALTVENGMRILGVNLPNKM